MRLTYSLILVLLVNTSVLLSVNATISGKITLKDGNRALPGVSVYLEGTKYGDASNGKGEYEIKGIPPGEYTLVISNIGFVTHSENLTINDESNISKDIQMAESVVDLPGVVVQSVTLTGGFSGIKEIPGSANYISPQEMERFNYTDINRTLRSVPGVNLQEEDGFGLRTNIGLRGTGSERSSKITIMEDGVLMAPAPYAAPAAYYFPTVGRMRAIEILKGSSQIKYGPYTTGGAINLISTQIPDKFSGRFLLMGGSFENRNIHANVGGSGENFGYMVETFQYNSEGFKNLDNGGVTGFDKKDYLGKIRINTDSDSDIYQSLTFKFGQVTELSNETYLGLTASDFDATPYRRYAASQMDEMDTEQRQLTLTHFVRVSDLLDIVTTAYRTDFKRNWYKLDRVNDNDGNSVSIGSLLDDPVNHSNAYSIITGTTSTDPNALNVKANNREYYAEGIQTIISFGFDGETIEQKVDFGFRYHRDEMDRFQWVDSYKMEDGVMKLSERGEPGTESNRVEFVDAIATYIQYKAKYGNLSVIPGIRYENISINREDFGKNDPGRTGSELKTSSNTVDVFIPGLGINYDIDQDLNVFAGIHKGFSPPGSAEGTEPEESINYELGSRFGLNGLQGQVVGFFNDYSNLLGADLAAAGGTGSGDLFNGGSATAIGIELQATYDLLVDVSSKFSLPATIVYTYTDAEFTSDFESTFGAWETVLSGDKLPYLANNQATIILSLMHSNFDISLSGKYMSEMRTVAGRGDIPENQKTDDYFVIDAGASYFINNNFSIFLNAKNISDEIYIVARRPAGLRPGLPASFNIGVKGNFR